MFWMLQAQTTYARTITTVYAGESILTVENICQEHPFSQQGFEALLEPLQPHSPSSAPEAGWQAWRFRLRRSDGIEGGVPRWEQERASAYSSLAGALSWRSR
jgi:hypothetical protein